MATTRRGVAVTVWRWLRSYGVLAALAVLVGRVAFRAWIGEVVPSPEFPPNGYDVVRDTIQLEWSLAREKGKTHLEVSAGDSSFSGAKAVDEDVDGKTYTLKDLKAGTTYYWRVSEGGLVSPVSYFRAAPDTVQY